MSHGEKKTKWQISLRGISLATAGIALAMGMIRYSLIEGESPPHEWPLFLSQIFALLLGVFIFWGSIGAVAMQLYDGIKINVISGFVCGGALGVVFCCVTVMMFGYLSL